MKKLSGQQNLNRIYVSARSRPTTWPTAAAVEAGAARRSTASAGRPDDFTVQTQDDMVALRTQTTQTR